MMKERFFAFIFRRIWQALTCLSVLLLEACQGPRQSAERLALPPTPLPSPTPTASPTPLPLSDLPVVPLPPLSAFSLQAEAAFNLPGAILFAASPGMAQWSDLYVVSPEGGQPLCLTCGLGPALEQGGYTAPRFDSPAWAPDGSRFAFVFHAVQRNSLLLLDRQGALQELRASRDDWYADLAWSPLGDALAFSTGPLAGRDYGASAVCLLRLDQTERENLLCVAPEKANRFPAWSPEGNRIVFSGGEGMYRPDGRPMDLFVWDLKTLLLSRLTETPRESEVAARWSPEGGRLAYIVHLRQGLNQADSRLWLADAAGRNAVPLPGTADIRAFAWSPDGRRIAFTRLSERPAEVCSQGDLPFTEMDVLDLASGRLLPLTDGGQWVDQPAWRP
jgi:Tol biopolymer transport system component